ncbi:MAG TPA: PAS domain S-box protein [Methylococcaceae bacterium]|nr:PAS domain S-box protein [Methylococcaceae bacterium]
MNTRRSPKNKASLCKGGGQDIPLCEKWELAISRLTSDFAYSVRIEPDGGLAMEWVTEPFGRITGYHTGEIAAGSEWLLPILPDDLPKFQRWLDSLRAGQTDICEYRAIARGGEILWLRDHAMPIRDWVEGRVVRVYGAAQDVTARRKAEDELSLMFRAIDSSGNGLVITGPEDTDYGIIYANSAFLRMTGYSMQELQGRNCRILQKEDRQQPDIEHLRAALAAGNDGYGVLRNYRKDGGMFWSEIYISPVRDQNERITHFIGVQNDVTERKQTEARLDASAREIEDLYDNAPCGYHSLGPDGAFLRINATELNWLGYTREEVVGKMKATDILTPASRKRFKRNFPVFKRAGHVEDLELEMVRKDGGILPVMVSATALKDPQGNYLMSRTAVYDISERKLAEAALSEKESQYRLAVETTADGFWVVDRQGKILEVNNAYLQLSGYSREELLAMRVFDIEARERAEETTAFMDKVMHTGHDRFDTLHRAKDGRIWPVEVIVTYSPLAGGRFFAFLKDISERIGNEQTQRNFASHLQSAREEERARISREIHDELGGILASLRLDMRWLARRLPADAPSHTKTVEMARLIEEAAQSVRRISTELRPSILDTLGLLAAIEWHVQQFSRRRNVSCHLSLPMAKHLDIENDRATAVFRILQEALNNVVLHAHARRVDIGIRTDHREITMTVADNGRGISGQKLSSPHSYGLLGMAERARHFGGKITIDSPSGGGTTVMLYMPLKTHAAGAEP